MSDLPPPDWYDDPEDLSQYRYWDGSQWTDHRAPRHRVGPEHRPIGELLTGTGRLLRANWRPFLAIYALTAVVYLAAEQLVRVGFDNVFGNTLTAMLDEIETLDTAAEGAGAAIEDRWNDVQDRIGSLSPTTAATGVLLMAIGGLAAVVANIIQVTALGHLAMRRLAHQPASATAALRAGLGRVLRIVGVALMLFVMLCAVCMVASLVLAVLTVAVGVLGATVVGVLGFLAAVAAFVLGVPLALVTLMTAAVGPAEPSMRYARKLLRGAYWATLGRTVFVLVLFAIALGVILLVAALAGLVASPLYTVTLYVLGVLPETFLIIALFTVYRDLGGEHAYVVEPVARPAD